MVNVKGLLKNTVQSAIKRNIPEVVVASVKVRQNEGKEEEEEQEGEY